MANVEAEVVYTRDLSSGRIHARYRVEGSTKLATREGCNLDEAGAYEIVDGVFVATSNPVLLCASDFPDGPASIAVDPDADDGTVEDDDGEA